jgi:hypothetical protein
MAVKEMGPGRHLIVGLLTSLVAALALAAPETGASQRLFERMGGLAGDWEGTFEWSGARTASGAMGARYYLTGNGSALVEDLLSDGKPSMTTVYHLDGADLRMTHYCAARNQPRLRATKVDPVRGRADFTLQDVTNVGPSNATHVEAFTLEMPEEGRLELTFVFGHGPKQATETIRLHRAR